MQKNQNQSNPFSLFETQQFWERFIDVLNDRAFEKCEKLLQSQRLVSYVTASHDFCDYCEAILYSEQNQWDKSESILRKLLRRTLHPALHMRVVNVLAIVCEHLGRLEEASDFYSQSLTIAEQADDRDFWAKVAKNRAICISLLYEAGIIGQDQLSATHRDLEKSIEIFQNLGERLEEGRSWNELGVLYKQLGQLGDAIACYQKDLAICRQLEHRHGIAASLNNIGEVLMAQAQYRAAVETLEEAVALFTLEQDAYEQADALVNLGKAQAKQGERTLARHALENAIRCVEQVRGELAQNSARIGFFSTQVNIYGANIAFELQEGNVHAAFARAEQARARGMLELLAGATIRQPLQIPPDLYEQERTLTESLQKARATSTSELPALESALSQLYQQMQALAPDYSSFKGLYPLTAEEVIAQLPEDTVVWAYFALPDHMIGFVLSKTGGTQAVELPISAEALAAASFDSTGHVRSLQPTASPWILEKFYATVVQPLLTKTPPCSRLLIVPHGPLHRLPLHAAYNPQAKQYLCDMFDIVYGQSTTIQVSILQAKRVQQQRHGVLALSAATEDLYHPLAEARHVAKIGNGEAFVGDSATTAQLLQQASQYQYLHFAGHAHFRKATPLLSGIDLADKRLTAWDLLQIPDLAFALVFVNGCESGANRIQPGDEALGLLRSLLYSIAPSVVATLYPIEDLSARIFAQLFFEQLFAHPVASSLRFSSVLRSTIQAFRHLTYDKLRAQLRHNGITAVDIEKIIAQHCQTVAQTQHTLQDSAHPFAHPYFWAAYTLTGEVWQHA